MTSLMHCHCGTCLLCCVLPISSSLLGLVVQVSSSILIFLLPFSFLLSLLSYFSLPSLSTLFFFPDFPFSLVGQERCRHCLPLMSWPRMWREQRLCWSSMKRGSRRSGTNRRSEWIALYRRTDTQTHARKHTHARMHPRQTKALSMLIHVLCIYIYCTMYINVYCTLEKQENLYNFSSTYIRICY